MAPADDLVISIEIGLDLDRHRRAEWTVCHLIRARPLHAHRPAAGRFRQQHRIERDVVGGVVAVASGAFEMFDGDVLDGNLEHQRHVGAQQIDALAVGPDMDAVAGPLRDCAGWRHRSMCDIGADILPFDRALYWGREGSLPCINDS